MIQEVLEYFDPLDYLGIWLLSTFILAFVVSWMSFPAIVAVVTNKHLMDEPCERSVHNTKTPTMGGVGIFLSLVFVITIMGGLLETKTLLLLFGGMTILFFLGLKDDLLVLSPRKKFFGQLLAAMVLIIFTDTRIMSFSGILGFGMLSYWFSVIFTLFVYLLIINAYNLIDGVDGLAGCLALFGCAAFAYLFFKTDDISMTTIAVATIGALLPFLKLNFSKKDKIFMGDTGSMIIGLLLAFFVVRFIGKEQMDKQSPFQIAAPVLAVCITFFPLLDTLRIFFIRAVIHKTSPFDADQNHLHHRFLQLGFNHIQTTSWIVLVNAMLFVCMLFITDLNVNLQLIILLVLGSLFYSLVFIYYYMVKLKLIPQVSLKRPKKL